MMPAYDLAVIGSGPGGSAAALATARRGLRVCLIERDRIGGVCLNVGCIPTKALLHVSQTVRRLSRARDMGIDIDGFRVNYAAVRAHSARVVSEVRQGLEGLLRHEGVEVVTGAAAFDDPHTLTVARPGGTDRVEARFIVVATGASPVAGPCAIDERRVLSYRGLLGLETLPRSLLIVGGGVIGCEFASCFSAFGTRVTIVEQQPQLLPAEDPEAVRWLASRLGAEGVEILTGTRIASISVSDSGVSALLATGAVVRADYCLMAVGQRPALEGLQLSNASVACRAGITVDPLLRTSMPHIAAIGDCLEGHGLAHWASAEGALAVRSLLDGDAEPLDPAAVPRGIFTDPEIAHIGLRESEAPGMQVSRVFFGAIGKSRCDGETDGFAKLIVEPSTGQVRGATIVGAQASSLIHHAVLAIHHRLTARQLSETITAHPTTPEIITEAAAHLYGQSLCVASRKTRPIAAR